jgi:hypothetical protein
LIVLGFGILCLSIATFSFLYFGDWLIKYLTELRNSEISIPYVDVLGNPNAFKLKKVDGSLHWMPRNTNDHFPGEEKDGEWRPFKQLALYVNGISTVTRAATQSQKYTVSVPLGDSPYHWFYPVDDSEVKRLEKWLKDSCAAEVPVNQKVIQDRGIGHVTLFAAPDQLICSESMVLYTSDGAKVATTYSEITAKPEAEPEAAPSTPSLPSDAVPENTIQGRLLDEDPSLEEDRRYNLGIVRDLALEERRRSIGGSCQK